MKRLFRNCRVLLPDHTVGAGPVLVENGVIVSAGAAAGGETPDAAVVSADETVDLKGALLMPGLVNAHGHTAMTLLRGLGGGLPLQRWLEEAIFPVEAKMTSADVAAGVTWGVMEMLASGTTLVGDMYDFPEAGAEAFAAAGMKANVCRVGICFSETEEAPPGRTRECIEFVRNFRDPAGRVLADFCVHSEYLTSERMVRALAEANAELRRPVHAHVSETEKEHRECLARRGRTPIGYLADLGLLDHGGYLAHAVWATDDDFAVVREKGAALVHNPTSNMKLGSGFSRVPAAIAAGATVALGTDGCASNDNLNMFEEMHLAALVHKGLAKDPTVLTAGDVLDMATVNGARALGRADTGAIAPGMRADFCAVDLDRPHLKPCLDVPNLLVYAAQASDVVMTVVDGEILYDHGTFTTIDAGRAEFEFLASVRRLMGR